MIIEARFNGPPGSGNGGYTAGLVAARLPLATGTIPEVTLRTPPPLDQPLRVVQPDDRTIEVYAGERLVAEARPVAPDGPGGGAWPAPVPAVSYEAATAAAAAYPGFEDHPFPTCYVCGPDRAPGDGLRIFPGPLPDEGPVRVSSEPARHPRRSAAFPAGSGAGQRGRSVGDGLGARTAAPWQVPEGASAVTVWAALDCPGGWAVIGRDFFARDCGTGKLAPHTSHPYVLGRIAAEVSELPPAGAACVLVGSVAAAEGRKAEVHTALYHPGPGGARLLARARSTWIRL